MKMIDDPINIKMVKKFMTVYDNPFSRNSVPICIGINYYKVIDDKDIVITKDEYYELLKNKEE